MRQLHRLELLLEDQDYAPGIKADFHEAPLLRTVLVDAAAVENTILPWAQLTSLALHGLFPRECVPILRQTVNLIHCELSLISDDEHVPHITLPVLQSLTLTHTLANDSVTGYLQTLTVPAVRHLRVPESFLGPELIDTLTSFISNSGCKLQELCVTGRKKGRTEGVSLRRSSKSSYRTAFPLATVSFAHWKISFADWVMSYNNF
ncbi:hypothetical protein K438DRAFT_1865775 [Mycena galopus ATCC 62051]|nr:hypothetical protein K438DRAFT_1865775 [Mycena galopus ATCC 62051]